MIKAKITTIALNLENKWVVDTYARIGTDLNDKKFIERFNNEYQGNGIENIKILESKELDYDFYTITDYLRAINSIMDKLTEIDGNYTVLDY